MIKIKQLLLLLFVGIAVSGCSSDTALVQINQEYVSKEVVNQIEIVNTGSTGVTLIPDTTTHVTVSFSTKINKQYVDDFQMHVSESNKTLTIQGPKPIFSLTGVTIDQPMIQLKVPQTLYEKIVVETASGNVTSSNVQAKVLQISTKSGQVTLSNEQLFNDINVETSSGNVSIGYTEKPVSLAIDYRSNSGKATLFIPDMLFSTNTDHQMIGTLGSGKPKISVLTNSGNFGVKQLSK
ncbi:DUF4097 family beta strand repeat-containing protein [Brevibacillus ginsengisoli]|uniref:DUF4097 family beta strand repeat-containing protein n=1 Tax=Brevibacillus ginsengisoli TaxID=363854 RepID=UPI003CEF2FCF